MSLIQSTTLSSPYATVTQTSRPLGQFERNESEVGPLAASMIGVADAAGDGLDTTVQLSQEGLSKLDSAADSLVDSAKSAAKDIASTLGDAYDTVKDGISEGVDDIENLATQGWQTLSSDAKTIGDKVSDVYDSLSNVASSAIDNVESAAGTAAGYAALGYQAGSQLLNAFV